MRPDEERKSGVYGVRSDRMNLFGSLATTSGWVRERGYPTMMQFLQDLAARVIV